MTLPGWNNLDTVTAIHRFFEIGGIVVLGVLVLFEAAAYYYGHRQEALAESATAETITKLKTSQAPRRLTDTQKAAIRAAISAYPGQPYSVMYVNVESDTPRFAQDFDEVLEAVWKRIKPPEPNNFVPTPTGLQIWVNIKYEQEKAIPAPAKSLNDALAALGLLDSDLISGGKNLLMANPTPPVGTVMVVVGMRPPHPL